MMIGINDFDTINTSIVGVVIIQNLVRYVISLIRMSDMRYHLFE